MSDALHQAIEETELGAFMVRYSVEGITIANAYRTEGTVWQLVFAGVGRSYDREAVTLEAANLFVRAAYVDMEARRVQ